ncbi:MAG: hypothetical protein KJ906_00200 [Nanoarchaeota archaeon]|nr:hypothetical protein [Nanoarchaeota archaeon]
MNKLILILIIIILIPLIAFFYPKDAGGTCGFCPGPPHIQRTEYGCIGFKFDYYPVGCLDCGTHIYCSGIVTSEKKCYTSIQGEQVEVPDCKNPETWGEILDICPDCYMQASGVAYINDGLDKAIEICNMISDESLANSCIKQKAQTAITNNNFDEAENVCNNYFEGYPKENCLQEIGTKMAETDVEAGVNFCNELITKAKDMCFHNIAVIARRSDEARALEICDMITEDTSTPPCREMIENYCNEYPC